MPDVELYDTTQDDFNIYIMSGLPASGKITYIKNNFSELPVIELDAIRIEMGVSQSDNQGTVRQEALKRAKDLLAKKQSFVWDGVNLDVNRRSPIIDLCCAYGGRVNIVHVETTYKEMMTRNQERNADRVPDSVIQKMLHKWSPPTRDEAHHVTMVW